MARVSFEGFRDPVRRPRFIIWTVVFVLVIVTVMVPVLGVTSSIWFCANGCHKVQDDTITAYQHSSHSQISCMACHMPVNANPIVFLLHKAEALGELAQTVTNNYELPLNPDDEVALTMKQVQCTQCHDEAKRHVSPSTGIKINHQIHADKAIACPICHNRIAHNENFVLTLNDPKTGKRNQKHENFMTMTACFRCHTQQQQAPGIPTGRCDACHTPDFTLKPASHLMPGFYPAGHAKLAKAEDARVIAAGGQSFLGSAETSQQVSTAEKSNGTKQGGVGPELRKVETINVCSTCHARSFCTDCHVLPMPHPASFQKDHGALGKATPATCAKCHGNATTFCNECHHGTEINYAIDPAVPWRIQHPKAVASLGASACFQCHDPTYCANCHVNGPPKQ